MTEKKQRNSIKPCVNNLIFGKNVDYLDYSHSIFLPQLSCLKADESSTVYFGFKLFPKMTIEFSLNKNLCGCI